MPIVFPRSGSGTSSSCAVDRAARTGPNIWPMSVGRSRGWPRRWPTASATTAGGIITASPVRYLTPQDDGGWLIGGDLGDLHAADVVIATPAPPLVAAMIADWASADDLARLTRHFLSGQPLPCAGTGPGVGVDLLAQRDRPGVSLCRRDRAHQLSRRPRAMAGATSSICRGICRRTMRCCNCLTLKFSTLRCRICNACFLSCSPPGSCATVSGARTGHSRWSSGNILRSSRRRTARDRGFIYVRWRRSTRKIEARITLSARGARWPQRLLAER